MNQVMMAMVVLAGVSQGMRAERLEKMLDARVEAFLDDVGARPDQRERVKQLEQQLKTDLVPVVKHGLQTREQLAEQWKAPAIDRVKVHALVDAQLERGKVFVHELADAFISLHDLLTPEQRAKAEERRAEMMQQRAALFQR